MDTIDLEQLKSAVHQSVLSKLDLEKLASVENVRARQAVATVVQETLASRNVPLTANEKGRIETDLLGYYPFFTANTAVGTAATALTEAVVDAAETALFSK